MDNEKKIFLTVYCQVFNFEEYLEDAFDSFIMQRTKFSFRVLVYDDASTDNSVRIVKKYIEAYPDIFVGYFSNKNMYNEPNRLQFLDEVMRQNVLGKYVAICEGDDYWKDPYKLQKQVDFMEMHSECSMVVHASEWINYKNGETYDFHPYHESRYLSPEEIILQQGGNPSTASQLYRVRDLVLDKDFRVKHVGDYARQLFEITRGKIYYMDEVMSVYRHRHAGSWSDRYYGNQQYALETSIRIHDLLERFDSLTNNKYHDSVRIAMCSNLYDSILLNPKVSMDEYENFLVENETISKDNIERYKEDRKRIGEIVRGIYTFSDKEKYLIECSKHVVVYGCGMYSEYVVNALKNNGISWDGYIISDSQSPKEPVNNKEVWRLSDYPFDFSSTVVVVGIDQKHEMEIRQSLGILEVLAVLDMFWFHL